MPKATAMHMAYTLALAMEDYADENLPLALDDEGTDSEFQVAYASGPTDQGNDMASIRVRLDNGQTMLIMVQSIGED
jgi:hypothetical protein